MDAVKMYIILILIASYFLALINTYFMSISTQLAWLFIMAIPVACISWTVTHEEVFREPRDYCIKNYQSAKKIYVRKFFYLFTCEYCFSHYIAAIFIYFTDFQLLLLGWKGYIIAGFALIFVANGYMSIFALIRQAIKKEKTEIKVMEKKVED